ncbi:hypothetical protein [Streptomyces virginiae]|uniref:hypothetical protein n=1 Tax=Streptomyces virginiae TaxID=1961 RepID=UPI002DB5B928|nr:hypothetical protein [Streptomyces sp. CMAA1738]MEC4572963.1 hypothetical protein [Streptomyces sp. CMAA1738]
MATAFVVRADITDPPFQGLDDRWLGRMGGPHDGPYMAVATVLNWFGGPVGAALPLALLVLLLVRRRLASAGSCPCSSSRGSSTWWTGPARPVRWYAWITAPSRRATRPRRRSSWSS